MVAKAIGIERTECRHCKRAMAILAAINNRIEVDRYFKQPGIENGPRAGATPRHQENDFELGSTKDLYETMATIDD